MNIVLIGNPKTSTERIETIATMLTEAKNNISYASIELLESGESTFLIEMFKQIDWADLVVAIPMEELAFDQLTTSEMVYAKHCKKPVFIYYE